MKKYIYTLFMMSLALASCTQTQENPSAEDVSGVRHP